MSLIGWVLISVAVGAWWFVSRRRALGAIWQRSCMGRAWKRTFPDASGREIRRFLELFTSAFGFHERRTLVFAPTDRILDVYKAAYPLDGLPDALELETFARDLDKHFGLDLYRAWRENLTLGEVFSLTRKAAA